MANNGAQMRVSTGPVKAILAALALVSGFSLAGGQASAQNLNNDPASALLVATTPYGGMAQSQAASLDAAPPGAYLQELTMVIAPGARMGVVLSDPIDSSRSKPGDKLRAVVKEPLKQNGLVLVPAGCKVFGTVTKVMPAHRRVFGTDGRLAIEFDRVEMPDGRQFPLSATLDERQMSEAAGLPGSRAERVAGKTITGAVTGAVTGGATGAISGALSGHSSHTSGASSARGLAVGSLVGATAGAGIGLLASTATRGSEAVVPAGTLLRLKLDEVLQLTALRPPVQNIQCGPARVPGFAGNTKAQSFVRKYPPAPVIGGSVF